MSEHSAISWTDATFNPWIGCTKVGPGCDNCYAERDFDLRKGIAKWGAGNPRHRTKTWGALRRWQRQAPAFFAEHGRKRRVFSASLADIFDNEVPQDWRADFWAEVRACPDLDLLIVTKRIGNVPKMLPPDWSSALYGHVVILITVVNQEEADRDIAKLLVLKLQFPWLRVGLSIEPMLGPIDLTFVDASTAEARTMGIKLDVLKPPHGLNWVICGGESGPNARPMHPDWARSLRDQCMAAGVPFHFKQWGEWGPDSGRPENSADHIMEGRARCAWYDGENWNFASNGYEVNLAEAKGSGEWIYRLGKKDAGRLLDGAEHNGFPTKE